MLLGDGDRGFLYTTFYRNIRWAAIRELYLSGIEISDHIAGCCQLQDIRKVVRWHPHMHL